MWPKLERAGLAAGMLWGVARGLEGGHRPGGLTREKEGGQGGGVITQYQHLRFTNYD